MTAATYEAPEVDPIEEDDPGDGLFWCGSGERDARGNRCQQRFPVRRLCDRHRAMILIAAARARVDTPITRAYLKQHPDLGELPAGTHNGIRQAEPAEETYRERTARLRDERRAALSAAITAYVRKHGGPQIRRDIAAAVGLDDSNRAFSESVALTIERGDLYHAKRGAPNALLGLYPTEADFHRAVDEAAAAVSA